MSRHEIPLIYDWRCHVTKMDPKLVASKEQYEVDYFAKKHDLSREKAMEVLKRAGPSREKADELAEKK